MDELAVSFGTPESKRLSKQWIPRGDPGPLMVRVYASMKKQMVFTFFDDVGLIYTIMPRLGQRSMSST